MFLDFTYVNEIIIRALITLLIVIVLFVLFRKRRIFIPLLRASGEALGKLLYIFKRALRPKEFLIIITVVLFLWILGRVYWYYPLLFLIMLLLFAVSIVRFVQSRK